MKKSILIACVFVVLMNINCKKDEEFKSYLRFKLENVQIECDRHIGASYTPPTINPLQNIISISGSWAGGSIELVLHHGQTLTPGTYIFHPSTYHSGDIWLPNESYSGMGGGEFNPLVGGSGHIIISEISTDYVKGTFECTLLSLIPGTPLKVLTNGSFHIRRQ